MQIYFEIEISQGKLSELVLKIKIPGKCEVHESMALNLLRKVTQSKSKTIITRSMLAISLIVFTDKFKPRKPMSED